MGYFPNSFGNKYILVVVDYVQVGRSHSSRTNDNKVVIKFLKENIFSRFEPLLLSSVTMVLTFAIDPLKLLCESMS